jgi:SAM-dependent methyltransferase
MQSARISAINSDVNPGTVDYHDASTRSPADARVGPIVPRSNARKHTSRNPLQRWLIRRFFDRVADLVWRHSGGRARRVLDTGCGEGFGARALLERGAVSAVYGVDADLASFEFGGAVDLLRPVCADAGRLPYGSGAVDAVICLEVLEHLEDPSAALREICCIPTGPNGLLVFSVPHQPWFSVANFLRGKNWPTRGDDPDHRHAWRPNTFVDLVMQHARVSAVEYAFPWLIVVAHPREP